MTERVGQQDPGRIPPMPGQPPQMGPVPPVAPSGHPPRWAWWVIGIVVPVVGTVATVFATSERNDPPPHAAGASAPAASASTPQTTPSPSKSATPSVAPLAPSPGTSSTSPSPAAGPDLSAPAGYRPQQGRWGIAPPPCGETLLVDLDAGVSTSVKVRRDGDTAPAEQTTATELEYRPEDLGCGNAGDAATYVQLRSATGRQVGVLRAGQPQTFENCRAAAGTGFGPVQLGGGAAQGRGLVKGAALCSVTDKGSVALALIEDVSKEYSPTMSGRLIVWAKE
ncbi:hypothetical protein ACFWBN_23490 [Streptomyces sp. NPDC059989]|uniref:hypothetical protein n=1 Tax=Streptomyces sp. NPDC059989 TaxID=3347026 RepID=UPI00368D404E